MIDRVGGDGCAGRVHSRRRYDFYRVVEWAGEKLKG